MNKINTTKKPSSPSSSASSLVAAFVPPSNHKREYATGGSSSSRSNSTYINNSPSEKQQEDFQVPATYSKFNANRQLAVPFPLQLMKILSTTNNTAEEDNVGIEWDVDGKKFYIKDRDKFVNCVLRKKCNAEKFTSFQRRLIRWGFHYNQKEKSYQNHLFQRNRVDLASKMRCRTTLTNNNKTRISSSARNSSSSCSIGNTSMDTSNQKKKIHQQNNSPPFMMPSECAAASLQVVETATRQNAPSSSSSSSSSKESPYSPVLGRYRIHQLPSNRNVYKQQSQPYQQQAFFETDVGAYVDSPAGCDNGKVVNGPNQPSATSSVRPFQPYDVYYGSTRYVGHQYHFVTPINQTDMNDELYTDSSLRAIDQLEHRKRQCEVGQQLPCSENGETSTVRGSRQSFTGSQTMSHDNVQRFATIRQATTLDDIAQGRQSPFQPLPLSFTPTHTEELQSQEAYSYFLPSRNEMDTESSHTARKSSTSQIKKVEDEWVLDPKSIFGEENC